MTSFSFLPRSLRPKSITVVRSNPKEEASFPAGIFLKATFSGITSKDKVEIVITSLCEQWLPRSCNYVQVISREEDQLVCIIRASSPRLAKILQGKLSAGGFNDSIYCEHVGELTTSEERQVWSRVPLRVKRRLQNQLATNNATKKTRRRAGHRKRKKSETNKGISISKGSID